VTGVQTCALPISQLDATINSYLGKDRTDKSLAVRKSQAPQRKQLRDDIDATQKRIDVLSEEKFQLESEIRKLQLDVGPIRYIAELIYGVENNSDKNIEAAVRIFTLIIVSTLDPLAVILLIAANHTLVRLQNEKKGKETSGNTHGPEVNQTPGQAVAGDEKKGSMSNEETIDGRTGGNDFLDLSLPVQEKDDTLSFPILQIPASVIDEKEKDVAEQDRYVPEVGVLSGNLQTESSNAGSQVGEEGKLSSTDETTATALPEITDEEKNAILEEIRSAEISLPLPIIRQPGASRVANRATEIYDQGESGAETSVQTKTANVNVISWADQNPVLREILGTGPHFIPQKLNEEDKPTKLETQKEGTEESTSQLETELSPQHETQEIYSETQTENLPEKQSQGGSENLVLQGPPESGNKYPKALSWLNEFKRL